LHLVGILFPHIDEDVRSKSHQIKLSIARSEKKTRSEDNRYPGRGLNPDPSKHETGSLPFWRSD